MIEMSFKAFLAQIEEALATSSADLPVDQRLQFGWGAEDFVISVLERFIGPVQKSSSAQDRGRDKLDAIIDASRIGQGKVLAQIKARESGEDILVEWYKDYPRLEGRDKIGTAQLYVTMSPNRDRIYLISAAALKAECARLFKLWLENSKPQTYRDTSGEVKAQPSRDIYGATKIMMYLKPGPLRSKGLPGWPTMIQVPSDMRGNPAQPVGGANKTLPQPSSPTRTATQTGGATSPPQATPKPGNPSVRA